MIIGCGIDVVEIHRVRNLRCRYQERFLNRLFTEGEREYCKRKKRTDIHLAGRFAAKEAFMKALGDKKRQLAWHDLEIVNNNAGKPEIFLLGEAQALLKDLQIGNIILSISHSNNIAVAQVILEK